MLSWDKLLNPERMRIKSTEKRSSTDVRSPFKKDFDTICNSSVLRRLQDKAQVFPLEIEDYARTRLTHSIEVLSVADSIAIPATLFIKKHLKDYLSRDCKTKGKKYSAIRKLVDDIPIILRSAALLHDMGNPPFGHLGEQIISDWFCEHFDGIVESGNENEGYLYSFGTATKGNSSLLSSILDKNMINDLSNFDGNAQLLRLVTKLCYATDEKGMNLTLPILATFIKYPCASSNINKEKLSTKKSGYFASEKDIFDRIEDTLGLSHCRHPLAFLLEAADDIAYLTADIEDAQRKGILSISDLETSLKKASTDKVISFVLSRIRDYREYASSIKYPNVDDYIIHRVRVLLKGVMIDAVQESFENLYSEIMNGRCEKELLSESKAQTLTKVLREIEKEKIYYCKSIVESKTRAFTIITKLLDTYVPAILNYSEKEKNKDTANNLVYRSLSENYRFVCENAIAISKSKAEILYNKLLLVTDQIAGMTDTHAMSVYNTITATSL